MARGIWWLASYPKSGNTYSCYLELQGSDTLRVRGYVLISLVGRTEIWTRTNDAR